MIPPRPTVPLPVIALPDMLPFQPQPQHHGRPTRIAAVNSSMIRSARIRDPRLAREQPQMKSPPSIPASIIGGNTTKSLPKIPKLSQTKSRESERVRESDRDPRLRKEDSKSSKDKSSSSRNKSSSSSTKSPSRSSSSRSSDRKKSSDKKHEDDRKSSTSRKSGSTHRSSSQSSSRSSRSKSPRLSYETKDLDMRRPIDSTMKPDSTTGVNKLLDELLNGEENKASQEIVSTNVNGKQSKPILVEKFCDKIESDIEWLMSNYVLKSDQLILYEALPNLKFAISYYY